MYFFDALYISSLAYYPSPTRPDLGQGLRLGLVKTSTQALNYPAQALKPCLTRPEHHYLEHSESYINPVAISHVP